MNLIMIPISVLVIIGLCAATTAAEETQFELIPPMERSAKLDHILRDYLEVKRSRDCEKIRKYVQWAFQEMTWYEERLERSASKCQRVPNSTATDQMNRVICVLENDLSREEKGALFFLAALFVLFVMIVGFIISLVVSMIWDILHELCLCLAGGSKAKSTQTVRVVARPKKKATVTVPLHVYRNGMV